MIDVFLISIHLNANQSKSIPTHDFVKLRCYLSIKSVRNDEILHFIMEESFVTLRSTRFMVILNYLISVKCASLVLVDIHSGSFGRNDKVAPIVDNIYKGSITIRNVLDAVKLFCSVVELKNKRL